MKEMKSIKRCLALLLALAMVISGMTIPEKKATAAEDTTVANEATEVNDASEGYVAQIGEQSYATFAEALDVANASSEAVTIKLLADVELTSSITINNTNHVDITIDGTNGDARYKLAITSNEASNPGIKIHQIKGNITFQNVDIEHGGNQMLLRLGENTYGKGTDRALTVNMTNMDITSTSTYAFCLMATQALGQFDINITDVNVDWNGNDTYTTERAFLRCGKDANNAQTVNLAATGCKIDVSATTKTQGMYICAGVSGEFKLNDTDILIPVAATAMYTNKGTATITSGADCTFTRIYKVAGADEFTTALTNANASAEDVIIKLVSDIQVTNKKITINNVNGKNITIDGANGDERYTLTLNEPNAHAILVHQASGVVTMQNLRLIHVEDGQSMLMRIGEGDYKNPKNITVKLQNMYIESNTPYQWCLMATQDTTTTNGKLGIDMEDVVVKWTGDFNQSGRAFLRCGKDAKNPQTVDFTATRCKIDVGDAEKTQGIYICAGVSGAFKLNNTDVIMPATVTAMYTKSSSATATVTLDNGCTFTYKVATASEFTSVVTSANASIEDVIIKLVADIQVENKQITINNTNGKNITIDGANGDERYTLTLKEPDAHAVLVHQASGMVTMQNLRLMHEEDGSYMLMRIGEGDYKNPKNITVKLQNMYIESNTPYQWCLMATQDTTTTNEKLGIDMEDVVVKWTGDFNQSGRAFMRCGDNSHQQTVDISMTGCSIDISETTGTQCFNVCSAVSGTIALADTDIITPGTKMYTNTGSVTINPDDDCTFIYKVDTVTEFTTALTNANASLEDVTIKLAANIELTSAIEINNAKGKNITIDGANGDGRHTLKITTTKPTNSSNHSIRVHQKKGNITFQNMNIVHGGDQMVFRMGEDKYTEATKKTLNVTLENMDITSTSTYTWCLMATQDLGQFDINMTNVKVDWNGDDDTQSSRAFLRCGKGINYAQTVNLTATGCIIDVSDTTKTQGMYICEGVSGTFTFIDTDIITPAAASVMYTNNGVVEIEVDDECNGIPDGCRTKCVQYDNVTAFKTSKGYIAPNTVPTGYVFAGWYTDKSCTAEHVLALDDTTTSAYAKFVPDHVINVKAQISANLLDGVSDGEKGAIRFATTVDSLDYQAVGFKYTITKATGEQLLQGQTTNTGAVYKKLYAVGTKDGGPLDYTPEIEFCAESEYFKAITFKNLSSTLFDAKITVTPFWITLNGTEVYGETVTKTVNQGINGGADSEGNLIGGSESTASVYTNRLVLLADAHYMTDNPGEGDAPSAGNTLGYTQVEKMSAILNDINGFANKNSVNGVLVLGDLGTDDYGYRNLSENYVQKFKDEVMTNFPGVSYALPGNHDTYPNDMWNDIFKYDRQYSVKIGDAAFIMLDTYALANGETITKGGSSYKGVDIQWLEKELKKYPTESIFLCCHNYVKGQIADNDAELKELIAKNDRIVCMFKGHSHNNGTYTPDSLAGIPLIEIGGYAYNVKSEPIKDSDGNPMVDSDGNPITTTDYNKFGASWAWGYQVLEWNEEEVHLYHVKPARTYTGTNGTFNFAGAIEDDIVIKLK